MGHLDDINEGYFQHMRFAVQFGLVMVLVGLCVIIHGIFPNVFQTTGSDAIRAMAEVLDEEGR